MFLFLRCFVRVYFWYSTYEILFVTIGTIVFHKEFWAICSCPTVLATSVSNIHFQLSRSTDNTVKIANNSLWKKVLLIVRLSMRFIWTEFVGEKKGSPYLTRKATALVFFVFELNFKPFTFVTQQFTPVFIDYFKRKDAFLRCSLIILAKLTPTKRKQKQKYFLQIFWQTFR